MRHPESFWKTFCFSFSLSHNIILLMHILFEFFFSFFFFFEKIGRQIKRTHGKKSLTHKEMKKKNVKDCSASNFEVKQITTNILKSVLVVGNRCIIKRI